MSIAEATQQLSPKMVNELRNTAKGSLYFFAKAILGYDRMVPHIHGPLCELMQDSSKKRKRILLPRGWFKTTVCSIAYPLWRAINDPNVRILIVQNTSTNAVAKLSAIDTHVQQNALFRGLFPELLPDKTCTWRSEAMQLKRTLTAPEATFEAAGIRTQVTSRHYDEIIQDDTVAPDLNELGEENIAPTKDDIEQAIGWHRLAPPLLVDPAESMITVVGTRWFEKDLLSWIEEHQKNYFSYTRACRETDGLPDANGKCTFPERFGEIVLAELEVAMGPYMFSCLYLNLPLRTSDMVFHNEWITFYDVESEGLIVTTTADPGGNPDDSKGPTDYNVVLTTGKSLRTGDIFILHYDRFRGSPGDFLDAIFKHVKLYHPVKVGVETVAYQKSLLYWIRERMQKENTYFLVEAIANTTKSKEARIRGLQPVVKSGMLKFRRWMTSLVSELLTFPYGAHDDLIDTLAMQLPLWAVTRAHQKEKVPEMQDPMSVDVAMAEIRGRLKAKRTRDPLADLLVPGTAYTGTL